MTGSLQGTDRMRLISHTDSQSRWTTQPQAGYPGRTEGRATEAYLEGYVE